MHNICVAILRCILHMTIDLYYEGRKRCKLWLPNSLIPQLSVSITDCCKCLVWFWCPWKPSHTVITVTYQVWYLYNTLEVYKEPYKTFKQSVLLTYTTFEMLLASTKWWFSLQYSLEAMEFLTLVFFFFLSSCLSSFLIFQKFLIILHASLY